MNDINNLNNITDLELATILKHLREVVFLQDINFDLLKTITVSRNFNYIKGDLELILIFEANSRFIKNTLND